MFKSLSYRHLLPDAFDLSSLAQALEEVVIPQIGRIAVAAFKAFDLSSLSRALDEDLAAHAACLTVAVSDAFNLSPLSLALEEVIATEVTCSPAKVVTDVIVTKATCPPTEIVTDVFDLSSLSRALDEYVPALAQLQVKVKHELPNMNYNLHITRTAPAATEFVNTIHDNITAAVTSSTISARKIEKSCVVETPAKVICAKPELPNMNYHLHIPRTAPTTTEFVNKVHDNLTAAVTSSTISARKAEKSRVLDTPAEVVDVKPVPTEAAKLAAPVRPPRIDMTNLASSSKVVVEDLKWRTGIVRCSSIFSKSSKRTQAPSATNQSNISHTNKRKCSDVITLPSRKRKLIVAFESFETGRQATKHKIDFVPESPVVPRIAPPLPFVNQRSESKLISEPAQSKALPPVNQRDESEKISESARTKALLPLDQRNESKQQKQISAGTSDTLVPDNKCKCNDVITLPSRKRKLSDAFESFETGRPATKLKIDFVLPVIVPTFPPVNQRSESKSKPAQSKALPPVNQRGETEKISESAWTKALVPLHQRNESKQSNQIPSISHTKSLPTKKRSHDDAFESPEVIVTKDPRKRRREVDTRPSNTTIPTTLSNHSKHSDEHPVQDIVIKSHGKEQPKPKREGEPYQTYCNEGDGLISYEEFEALADRSTLHQLENDRQTIITSFPVGKWTCHAEDVFAEGQVENNVNVDEFIAECCGVIVEEPQREILASTNVEVEDSAEGDDDQMQEAVVEEGSIDEEEAEVDEDEDEDEEEQEARQARYLQLCREVFGDGEDSDEDY